MGPGPNERGLSRKHIMSSIDASLKRLGTDYVDLYQIHRWDYETPIEETLEALHDVVRAGKARYIGASAMYAWQFAKALFTAELHGWTRFVSMQPHYNLIYREEEREMLPLCQDQKIAVIPFSPLARGVLARKLAQGQEETIRYQSDSLAKSRYAQDDNLTTVRARQRTGRGARPADGTGGPGLDALQTGCHRPDHWGNQASPPGRCHRSPLCPAYPGGNPAFGRTLSPPSHHRPLIICKT